MGLLRDMANKIKSFEEEVFNVNTNSSAEKTNYNGEGYLYKESRKADAEDIAKMKYIINHTNDERIKLLIQERLNQCVYEYKDILNRHGLDESQFDMF
jgi:hypothetical protein